MKTAPYGVVAYVWNAREHFYIYCYDAIPYWLDRGYSFCYENGCGTEKAAPAVAQAIREAKARNE